MDNKTKYIIISLIGAAAVSFLLYFIVGSGSSEYTVLFDSAGGSEIDKQVIKKGEKVSKPTDPIKEDYNFVEWQLDGTAYDFDTTVTKNITLIAKWMEIIKHNVKVTIDGIEYMADIKEGELITIEALNIPAKEGYKVVFYDQDNKEYDISTGISADVVLTAKYVEIKTYTVKFDSQGGSKVADAKVVEGELVSEPTSTKDGYILDGWYNGKEKYDFTTPVNSNLTLKAKWVDGTKLKVTFNVDDKEYHTAQVRENTKVTAPDNPAKKGYKFVEWQLDNKKFDFNTKITSDITLVAVFKETKSYTVTFNTDGGNKIDSQEVKVGGKATAPTTPVKDGYIFVEWQVKGKKYDYSKEVIEDLTIKAVWKEEKIEYTVTFDSYGGSNVDNQKVKKGGKATKPTDPTKDGYKFVEWLLDNSSYDFNKEVTGDITLTARYEKVEIATPTPVPATPTPVPDKYVIILSAVSIGSPDYVAKVYKNDAETNFNELEYTFGGKPGVWIDGKYIIGKADLVDNSGKDITELVVKLKDGGTARATVKFQ